MNKFYLFLIMSIGAVFVTAFMFGSTVTSALAQGNETGEVQVGEPLFLQPTDNMTMSNMTNNNVTTAVGDSSAPTVLLHKMMDQTSDDGLELR